MTQSPVHHKEEDSTVLRSEDANLDTQDAPQSAQKGPRKRTKTGCLTCRKRRIKCGEEKYIIRSCLLDLTKPTLQANMFQLYQVEKIL